MISSNIIPRHSIPPSRSNPTPHHTTPPYPISTPNNHLPPAPPFFIPPHPIPLLPTHPTPPNPFPTVDSHPTSSRVQIHSLAKELYLAKPTNVPADKWISPDPSDIPPRDVAFSLTSNLNSTLQFFLVSARYHELALLLPVRSSAVARSGECWRWI